MKTLIFTILFIIALLAFLSSLLAFELFGIIFWGVLTFVFKNVAFGK